MSRLDGIPEAGGFKGGKGRKNKNNGPLGQLRDNSGEDMTDFKEPEPDSLSLSNNPDEESVLTSSASNMKVEEDSSSCLKRTSRETRREWCVTEIKTFNVDYCVEVYCEVCCSLYVPFNQIKKCAR